MSVLFVCTVNRHRSVIAEYIFRALLAKSAPGANIGVSSAGILPTGEGVPSLEETPIFGYRPMACVILHLQKRGIDASEHRSRELTAQLATQADLIVAMGESHRHRILSAFPETGNKLFSLAELSHTFEFEDIAVGEPPGIMPPNDFCMLECDHWDITALMSKEVEERLEEAAPAIVRML